MTKTIYSQVTMAALIMIHDLATPESDNYMFSQGTIDYKKGDVKAFRLSKGYDFKIIKQTARDNTGVPATSAASERVFCSREIKPMG